jgi:hypothetical protein
MRTTCSMLNATYKIGWFKIIVGVSVAYNFQTGNNKIKLLTEYEGIYIQHEDVFRQTGNMRLLQWQLLMQLWQNMTRTENVGHKLHMDDFFLLLPYLMIYILRPKNAVVLSD